MGQYNFDQILDRTHTKSLKYDFAVKRGKPADVLPFWVADMDFEIPPELKTNLIGPREPWRIWLYRIR